MLPLGNNPKISESLVLVGDEQRGYSVRNTTDLVLRDVGIFRRAKTSKENRQSADDISIETAYVARLDPATSAPLRFSPMPDQAEIQEAADRKRDPSTASHYPAVWLPEWDSSPAFGSSGSRINERDKRVRLARLARLAIQRLRLLPGDVRLVAWTDQRLPGLRINPEAPQNLTYTLVLAHLSRGTLPPVKPDRNVAEDYMGPSDVIDDTPLPDAKDLNDDPTIP